jgi:hypothetical protein
MASLRDIRRSAGLHDRAGAASPLNLDEDSVRERCYLVLPAILKRTFDRGHKDLVLGDRH